MFESVSGRTAARLVYYKLTLLAFGSGELKRRKQNKNKEGDAIRHIKISVILV